MKYESLVADKNKFSATCIYKFSTDIKRICVPLKDINIHDICYCEYSSDNKKLLCLVNNLESPEIYIRNNGMPLDPYLSLKTQLPPGLYTNIWHRGFQSKEAKRFLHKLNEFNPLKDGCAIIKQNKKGKRAESR